VLFLKKLFKKSDLSRGFTLVELLVVIAIIGILSTLLLLQLNIARQKARDAKRVADINQIRSAMELYYDDKGYYPASNLNVATGLLALTPYLTRVPSDPGRTVCLLGAGTTGYVGSATPGSESNPCYGYAYYGGAANATPTKFQLWTELEQKASSALGNDLDFNSVTADSAGWSGATIDGSQESADTCLATVVDCVYDVGQPN